MSGGDYLDETHQRIAEFAESFLEEDEREDFVGALMERHGYQRQSHWAPPAPDEGGGKQPLVKPKSGRQGSRQPQQQQSQQRSSYFKR